MGCIVVSKYTTQVRYICEQAAGISEGSVREIIKASWEKIFDFDFPIWDESYKEVLCSKILKHYYTREIGFETVGLWKLKLETKMCEIMPFFNERYISTNYKYSPLFDVDYYRTTKGKDDGVNARNGERSSVNNDSGESSSESKSINKFSDTPQGGLVGVENDNYLTNVTLVNRDGSSEYVRSGSTRDTTSEDGSFSTTKDYVEHIFGKMPGISYGKAIKEYRDNLINIDFEIIDELKDLFMLVW